MADYGEGRTTSIRKSSLLYQIILRLDAWYIGFFLLLELIIYIYKCSILPYPAGNIAAEIILLFFLAIVEAARNFFGQKGNLTEHSLGIIVSLVLTIPAVFGVLYYLLWQTYVLKLEVILTAIQLGFQAFQVVLSVFCLIKFSQ